MAGHEGLTRLVAVKTVKEGATEKEHAELIKELEIMQQIGSHPNIVTLLGCCTEQGLYTFKDNNLDRLFVMLFIIALEIKNHALKIKIPILLTIFSYAW